MHVEPLSAVKVIAPRSWERRLRLEISAGIVEGKSKIRYESSPIEPEPRISGTPPMQLCAVCSSEI